MNTITKGTKVLRSGFEGTVISEYIPGMYEVKLKSGTVVVPGSELKIICSWCKDTPALPYNDLCRSCNGLMG